MALVHVTEVFKQAPGELGNPTIRIELDGIWTGSTTRSNLYFPFLSNPGEH